MACALCVSVVCGWGVCGGECDESGRELRAQNIGGVASNTKGSFVLASLPRLPLAFTDPHNHIMRGKGMQGLNPSVFVVTLGLWF